MRNLCSFGLVVDHFGASWKAVIARSLTFEPRQIEGWSWWQNWPISCALQLCCWVEDINSNSLGSRPASMKMYKIRRNGSGCRDYIGQMAIAKELLTSCREKMIDKYIRTNSERRGEPF